MKKYNELKFNKTYNKYLSSKEYSLENNVIENYQEIIYDFLKKAMYENFKNKKINKNNIDKIIKYCMLVVNYENMPRQIVEAFKLIIEDYKYLLITENIEYFFKDYYELELVNQENEVYVDDIILDINKHIIFSKKNEKNFITLLIIIQNKYGILETKLMSIFKSVLCKY